MHVDGSSNTVGLILSGPDGTVIEYALHFEFLATSKEDECEALTTGLKITKDLGIQDLKAYSDFQLIVGHVRGDYEARGEYILKYLQKIKSLTFVLSNFEIQ